MAVSRKPKTPYGVHCNLQATLEAIGQLDDETIMNWGQGFDWSQPVERLTLSRKDGGLPHLEILSAAEVLIDQRDPRLNALLLRRDMFSLCAYSTDRSHKTLLGELDGAEYAHLSTDGTLMAAAFDRALGVSDMESVRMLAQWMQMPDRFSLQRWHMIQMTHEKRKCGLFANKEPLPALLAALDFCEEMVYRDAREFRPYDDKRKPAAFQQEHLHAWRHWMCVQALEQSNSRLANVLLDRMQGRPSSAMLVALFRKDNWKELREMVEHACTAGMLAVPVWPGGQIIRSYAAFGLVPGNLAENVAAKLTQAEVPASQVQEMALDLLSGHYNVPGELPSEANLIPTLLACRAKDWNSEVLSALRQVFPAPAHGELTHLIDKAGNEAWAARLQDWCTQSEPDRVAGVVSLMANAPAELLQDTALACRLGELFATIPEAQSRNLPQLYRLGAHAPQVQASEQRCRLDAQTRPSTAPARNRRM